MPISTKSALIALASLVAAASAASASAAVLYSENFDSMTTGNLVGQGSWNQTSTTTANPIQVNGTTGLVSIGNSGQDANTLLASPVTAGSSVYSASVVSFSAGGTTGDYFLHYAQSNTDTSAFTARLFVKSTTGGVLLGLQFGSGGVTYGSGVIPLSTSTTIVLRYDIVAGTLNDTAAIYVNPTDNTTESNNTPYATFSDVGGVTESAQTFGSVNLRQGGGAVAPTLTLDKLTVATTFAEALSNPANLNTPAPIPEPASLSLLALGAAALLTRRRK